MAVRTFGIGAAVGVMVDLAMSLVLVPTLLMLLRPETGVAPQERYLVAPMRGVARFSMRFARPVVLVTLLLLTLAAAGATRLRVDTNHINFFAEDHPLHQSAVVIDEQLSGRLQLQRPARRARGVDADSGRAGTHAGAAGEAGAAAIRAEGRVAGRLREARQPGAQRR